MIGLSLQKVPTEIIDLEPLGELGHGTCGHVVKMRHKKTDHVMAVKVSINHSLQQVYAWLVFIRIGKINTWKGGTVVKWQNPPPQSLVVTM